MFDAIFFYIIITASGITASLDLGLWLVQKYGGAEKAIEISKQLEFELRGPFGSESETIDENITLHLVLNQTITIPP